MLIVLQNHSVHNKIEFHLVRFEDYGLKWKWIEFDRIFIRKCQIWTGYFSNNDATWMIQIIELFSITNVRWFSRSFRCFWFQLNRRRRRRSLIEIFISHLLYKSIELNENPFELELYSLLNKEQFYMNLDSLYHWVITKYKDN